MKQHKSITFRHIIRYFLP